LHERIAKGDPEAAGAAMEIAGLERDAIYNAL